MHTEADWKKFSEMVPKLRERYLAERNPKFAALLIDPKKNESERFWDAIEAMKKEAKTLRYCLDGHSRSKMFIYMLSMIGAGMLTKEDLTVFSEELQKSIDDVIEKKKG
jgi:hypothetical protein